MSKIKRKYVEKYLYGINKETLTTLKLIFKNDYSKQFLDPNGADRNVGFSGDFLTGDIFEIKNIGTNYNLTVTSITPNKIIHPGEKVGFFYDGSDWNIADDEYVFFELDSNGDLMPV